MWGQPSSQPDTTGLVGLGKGTAVASGNLFSYCQNSPLGAGSAPCFTAQRGPWVVDRFWWLMENLAQCSASSAKVPVWEEFKGDPLTRLNDRRPHTSTQWHMVGLGGWKVYFINVIESLSLVESYENAAYCHINRLLVIKAWLSFVEWDALRFSRSYRQGNIPRSLGSKYLEEHRKRNWYLFWKHCRHEYGLSGIQQMGLLD